MAETEASVRLGLNAGGFKSGLKRTETDVASSSRRMGSSFQRGMEAGVKGGLSAVRGLFSTIKSGVGIVTGLLGGIGFGSLIKGAIDADAQMRRLSFTLGAGRKDFQALEQIQGRLQQSALKWGIAQEDLAEAARSVFLTVGDAGFAQGAVEAIAQAARASGEPVQALSGIVAEMNRQFDVTQEEVPEALATVLSLANRGGLSVEELGVNLGKLGRTARVAGLQGEKGMAQLIGLTNQISASAGTAEGSVEKLQALFKVLGERERVKKAIQVDIEGMNAIQALEAILSKTGGQASQLTKVFGEQGLFIAQAFGERFKGVVEATSGTDAEKTAAALKDFKTALDDASEGALDVADVQKKAEENMAAPAAGIDKALEMLKTAFTKPEMMNAIEQLAQNLPKLAEGIADLLSFVLESPVAAGGIALGGVALKGGIQATLTQAITQSFATGGQTAASSIEGALVSGGKSAGGSIAGGFAGTLALTAALAAWTLAADQYTKLQQDLAQQQKDTADLNENLLQVEERRGKEFAVKEQTAAERIFGRETLQEGIMDVMEGRRKKTLITRDPKTGKAIERGFREDFETVSIPLTTEVPTAKARRGLSPEDAERVAKGLMPLGEETLTEQMMGGLIVGPQRPAEVDETGTGGGQGAEQITSAVKSGNDQIAQAVQNLPQQELRVRLVNPEDIRGTAAPTPGTPVPGNVAR